MHSWFDFAPLVNNKDMYNLSKDWENKKKIKNKKKRQNDFYECLPPRGKSWATTVSLPAAKWHSEPPHLVKNK